MHTNYDSINWKLSRFLPFCNDTEYAKMKDLHFKTVKIALMRACTRVTIIL